MERWRRIAESAKRAWDDRPPGRGRHSVLPEGSDRGRTGQRDRQVEPGDAPTTAAPGVG
jgi:hypothetical protein